MSNKVEVISKPSELKRDEPFVLMFVASFHEACQPGGQMDQVINALAAKNPNLRFYKVDAEEASDLVEEFAVEVVPTFCFALPGQKRAVDRVEGAVPAKIMEKLEQFKTSATATGKASSSSDNTVHQKIDKLVNSSFVFLFMKGKPQDPKCKFSKKVMELLKNARVVNFASFDVLSDETIRAGVKEYSNWPTFPQLFVGGKLVGGVDILEDMGSEDLFEVCQPPQPKSVSTQPAKETLNDKLTRLVNQAPVMVFIKGVPENPQCGFSAQIVKLLKRDNVEFSSFDILTDESVRQGLKTFSDWPTFPQLYVHGKLVGGLDVAKELAEEEGGLGALL